uniref:Uncharacterized protein n=1 Tax=Ciona savignyi TaxID=51511 RepID=H2YBW0_CIOSA
KTCPDRLLPVETGGKKAPSVPNARQSALSQTQKSGQSSSKSTNEKESSSSKSSGSSKSGESSKSTFTSEQGSSGSGNNRENSENLPENSRTIKMEPFIDDEEDLKPKIKKEKPSAGASLKNRRILIRPVFNLPSGSQKTKGAGSKDVYDPFDPTEDDELSIHPQESDDLLYDPFQPIVS